MKVRSMHKLKALALSLLVFALFLPFVLPFVSVKAEAYAPAKVPTETLNAAGSVYKTAFDKWGNATTQYTEKGFEIVVPATTSEQGIYSVNELSVTKDNPLALKVNLPLYQDAPFDANGTKTLTDETYQRSALNIILYADTKATAPLVQLTIWGGTTSKSDPQGKGWASANLYVYKGVENDRSIVAQIANIKLIGTATESGEFALTFDNENFFQSEVWNGQSGGKEQYAEQCIVDWGWYKKVENNVVVQQFTPAQVKEALQKTFSGRPYIKEVKISLQNSNGTAGKFYITQFKGQSLKVQDGGIVFKDWIPFFGAKVVNGASFVTDKTYRFEITNSLDNYVAGTTTAQDVAMLGKVASGGSYMYGNIGWYRDSGVYIDVIAPDSTVESFATKDSWNNIPFSFKKIGENTVKISILTKTGVTDSKTVKVNVGLGDVDMTTYDGASIRLSENAGIRFGAKILKTDYEALTTLYGAENVKIGMYVERGDGAYAYVEAVNTREEDGYICFNAVIINIPTARYNTQYSAKAYVEVRFNGDTQRIYKEAENGNARTIAEVAQDALNSGKYTGTEYEAILRGFIGERL